MPSDPKEHGIPRMPAGLPPDVSPRGGHQSAGRRPRLTVDVDDASLVPPYEQIRSQIASLIEAGSLPTGFALPPIRQLAADLDLAPGTVARAYRELDGAGLVTGRGRSGTKVAPHGALGAKEIDRRLTQAARKYLNLAKALGVSAEEAVAELHRVRETDR